MNLVVSADGVPATPVEYQAIVRQDAGRTPASPPVTVDRANPTRVKVEWDEVRSHEDRIAEQAETMAAQMNNGGATADSDLVDQLRAAFPGAESRSLAHPEPGGSDRRRLDRAARTARGAHRAGALTDEEFAAAKARLLG